MRFAMVAMLALIASCGDSGGDGPGGAGGTYSCRAVSPGTDGGVGTTAVCLEASGGSAQDLASNRQQCAAQGNTFAQEPCPHEGALGGCRETTTGSTGVLTNWYYADGYSTAADIQSLCEGLAGVAPKVIKIEFVRP
jgi:hypothetical protein